MPANLELYYDTPAAGLQRITIDPINPQVGNVFTLEFDGETVSFTATDATDANVVAGLKAAIEASEAAAWEPITATISADGDRLILTYSTVTGTTRIWRGDAPAVAQVTTITPENVSAGDTFTITINGKPVTYSATASTAANVAAGLLAAINASTLPEFADFDATVSGGVLTLTASQLGVPFTVTAGAASGLGIVTVTETQQPQTGTKRRFEWVVPDTFTTFRVRYRGEQTSALTTASVTEAALNTALNSNTNISGADATITTLSTGRKFVVLWNDDGTNNLPVVSSGQLFLGVETTDAGPPEVQRLSFTSFEVGTADSTFQLTLDGYTTAPIEYSCNESELEAALHALPNVAVGSVVSTVRTVTTLGGQLRVYFDITFNAAYGDVSLMTAGWVVEPLDSVVTVTATQAGIASRNQRYAVTVDADAGTYTLTAAGQTTSALAYNANAAAVEAALEALSSVDAATVTGTASAYTVEFSGSLAETAVVMTANASGLTGSGTEELVIATPIPSSGPSHWDAAKNWSPEGVPVTGDRVQIESGNTSILYGLNQSSVLLVSLEISHSYSGQIGLPRRNAQGFVEYRERHLKIGSTSIEIGHGAGFGSSRIQLDTGVSQTALLVRNSGSASDPAESAVTWIGDNSLNTITIHAGEFGVAPYSDQSAVFHTLTSYGGTCRLQNCSCVDVLATGQTVFARRAVISRNLSL